MVNWFEQIDNVALKIIGHEENNIYFASIDLKYAYGQTPLWRKSSNQCNFNMVGGYVKGSLRFRTEFHVLGYMSNEFQQIMDQLTEILV